MTCYWVALLVLALVLVVAPLMAAADAGRENYLPTWESLDTHKTPGWLVDAKLGLFVYPLHPTKAEWDSYWQRHESCQKGISGAGVHEQRHWQD